MLCLCYVMLCCGQGSYFIRDQKCVLLQIMLAIENRCALDSIEESFQNHSKVREEFANVGCLMSLHSQHLEMSFFSLHNTWKCHSSAYKLSFEVKIPLQLMCDIIDWWIKVRDSQLFNLALLTHLNTPHSRAWCCYSVLLRSLFFRGLWPFPKCTMLINNSFPKLSITIRESLGIMDPIERIMGSLFSYILYALHDL